MRTRAFSDCSCFLHSCSSRRSILSRTWPLVVSDTWLLRHAWDSVDPYVQIICENTKGLDCFPDEGFAHQIDVTVGAALLIEWAARKKAKNTAVRVLQQLISGGMGSAEDLEKTRKRLNKITTNIKNEIKTNSEDRFTPESIQARLSSPFRLPQGVHYPRLLTAKQQAKSALRTYPGELECPLLPVLHAGRAHHDDNSFSPSHLLPAPPQYAPPLRQSILYAFIKIAGAREVLQHCSDETGIHRQGTYNQWVRFRNSDDEIETIYIETGGILVGATAVEVAAHIEKTWERGQAMVEALRAELGAEADRLVPIVNGGVNLLKLRSLMHDTCNTANATAREIARLVEEKGREYYGDEGWDDLPEEEKFILDFLCGNHTRGLPVDAFNRRFEDWLAEELSAEFDAAAGESGGHARLEKSGTSLLRSLFKLIHSGWGAYEKVRFKYLLVIVAHVFCFRFRFSHKNPLLLACEGRWGRVPRPTA